MGRDYNAEILNAFPAEDLVNLGYDQKDLFDAEMIPKIFFDKMAYEVRNRGQLSALLTSLSTFKNGVADSVLRWTCGDEEASTTFITTATSYVYTTAGTAGSIALDIDSLVAGDYILLEQYASSEFYQALLKVTSIKGGGITAASGEYEVVEVNFETSHISATGFTFLAAGADVTSMVSTVPMDGIANDPNTITPMPLENYMERIRVSGVIGSHSNAGNQNWNGSIDKQMKLKMVTFLERLNLTLALRIGSQNPTTVAGNTGRMKTFRDFYSPHDRTATLISGKSISGKNCVLNSTIDIDEIEEYMDIITQYSNTSHEKLLVCTPGFSRRLWRAYADSTVVQVSKFTVPGTDKIWKGVTIELGGGTLRLIPDRTLAKSKMYIEDNCLNTSTQVNTDHWGLIVDTEFTDLVYRNVADAPINPGIQSPKILDVDLSHNNDNKMKEITAELTLFIKRPEVGGYIGIAHV